MSANHGLYSRYSKTQQYINIMMCWYCTRVLIWRVAVMGGFGRQSHDEAY